MVTVRIKLVEIKCPCALRQKSPKDAARQRECQQSISTGEWRLCETSEYYYQIQTHLFLYGLSQRDLVMYTLQGILAVPLYLKCVFCFVLVLFVCFLS